MVWLRRPLLSKSTFKTLFRRLSQAGFKRSFVHSAILPDWWDEECSADVDLLPEIELRVARFLGLPVSVVHDPAAQLNVPSYPEAQLRRVRNVDRDRLTPAIHSALQVAGAVVRSLRSRERTDQALPEDGLAWRRSLKESGGAVTLGDMLGDLWGRGIPVVPLETLPSPNFQGLACIVEGHAAIILGHKHDEPGRAAFVVAHEAAHVALGDCRPDQPIVDEDPSILDDADIEQAADRYARRLLVGGQDIPQLEGKDYKDLARRAAQIESETGADASLILFAWAARRGDYVTATRAVQALYRGVGARRILREHFDHEVDLNLATETDRALLRCVFGDPTWDEAAH